MRKLRNALSLGVASRLTAEATPVQAESFVLQTGWVESIVLAALTDDDPVFVSGVPEALSAGGGCS